MAILVQAIADRVRGTGLDAEGSDHYRDDLDVIPAVNSAMTWMVNVVNMALSERKMSAEIFRELTLARVWQLNGFSRFAFDPADVGHGLWTVLSIHPKPEVWIPAFTPAADFPLHSIWYHQFLAANQNVSAVDGPIIDRRPRTGAIMEKHESVLRPELAYVGSEFDCKRLTHEEWVRNRKNPFKPGNIIKSMDCDDVRFAYLDPTDYNTVPGGYSTTEAYEFEIRPNIPHRLVAIVYVRVPAQVALVTDSVPFPDSFFDMMVSKTLQIISHKQGDNTNIFSVAARDIQSLITAIA
jgi:hypothetical protein